MLAVIVAVLSVAPQFVFMQDDSYQGVEMFATDAELFYLSRIQEVVDGERTISNAYLEDKSIPYLYPILDENISATVAQVTGQSVPRANILLKFVSPFLMFLLIYALWLRIFNDKRIAILSVFLTFFAYSLVDGPSYVIDLLKLQVQTADFLPYTRPIHPSISGFFLFGVLCLLWPIVSGSGDKTKWWRLALIGLLSGLSLYSYVYFWTFLVVFVGLYGIYYLYKKEWGMFREMVVITVVNLLATIPYWLNYLAARAHEFYVETAFRNGLVHTREFVNSTWLFIFLIAMLIPWPELYRRAKPFMWAFVLSLIIVTEQHMITGIKLHHSHYHFYIGKPLISIFAAFLFVYLVDRFVKLEMIKWGLVILAGAVLFLNGYLIQTASYDRYYDEFVNAQRYAPLVEYLNEFDETRNVWAEVREDSDLLAAYTHHNTPNHDSLAYALGSNDFMVDRMLLNYRILGIADIDIFDYLLENRSDASQGAFVMGYRELSGSYGSIPDEHLKQIAERYQEFMERSYADVFSQFSVDLIINDLTVRTELESVPGLKEVKRINEDFVVYELQSL